jgi:branched-chain amino acid transport system substrate-binding protein
MTRLFDHAASVAVSASFLVALSAATACSPSSALGTTVTGDTAYVGVAVGLQSPERYADVFNGVQVALDELNAARPAGAPILAMRRPPADAKAATQVAAAFRDDPKVVGVVGHTESDPTISAAAVYDDHEHGGRNAIVAVSPTAGAAGVTLASEWVFRVCPVVSQQATTLARYITDSLKLSRVAIIYRNDVSGREFLGTFANTITAHNAKLLERDPFAEELAEFDLYAARLAQRKPDGILAFANASDVRKIVRSLHAAGISPVVVSTNGPTHQELTRDSSAARDFAGLKYLALFLPDRATTATAVRFVLEFQLAFNRKPDHWGALGYDAAMLIGHATQESGRDRRKIRDWIASVGRSQPAFAGATGEIRFDDSRNPVDKAALVTTVSR